MADNTTLNLGVGGDVIRTEDKNGAKTQVVTLDLGGAGAENLINGSMPITGSVSVSGAVEIANDAGNPIPVSGSFTNPSSTDGTQKTRIATATNEAAIEAFGSLSVNTGFQTLFYDSWSTSPIDTTEKWTVTGTAPTIAGGNMQMSANLLSYNAIQTKDTIRPNVGFTHVRNGIRLEAAAAQGAGRFWGLGTPALSPSATSLVQDGVGFEIDQNTGNLLAVTYTGGTRTTVATLTRPTDGALHRYGLSFRVTTAFWFIDDQQNPVATQSFPNVTVVELPALIVRQNAVSLTGAPVFVNIAHLTADTSRQSYVFGDPVIGTRQARVKAPNTLPVATDSALVVTVRDAVKLTNDPRTYVSYFAGGVTAAATTTEALITLTKSGGVGVATSTGTSFVIPAGKRFRITSVTFASRGNATATSQNSTFSIRANTAGAITTTSPAFLTGRTATPGTASTYDRFFINFGADGVEIAGDGTLQFGVSAVSVYTTNAPTWDVTITGYEY